MNRHGIYNLFYPDIWIGAPGKREDFPTLEPLEVYAERRQISFLHPIRRGRVLRLLAATPARQAPIR